MYSTKGVGSSFPEMMKLMALYESHSGPDVFTIAGKNEMTQIEAALHDNESRMTRNSTPNASVAA